MKTLLAKVAAPEPSLLDVGTATGAGANVIAERFPRVRVDAIDLIRRYRVALKGPCTTPVGKGFRSINVRLRQGLDLFASVRPV